MFGDLVFSCKNFFVCLFVFRRGGSGGGGGRGGLRLRKKNEKFFLKKLPCLKMGIQVFVQIGSLGKRS